MNPDSADSTFQPLPPAELRPEEAVVAPPVVAAAEPVLAELVPEPQPIRQYPSLRRRVGVPVLLFAATCLSTFWAGLDCGTYQIRSPELFGTIVELPELLSHNWTDGLVYMAAVMSILLAHEMGHFLQARRYQIPASLPFFIPMPLTPIGTMGAVIGMNGSQADRKELFDIGLSGPLAGLIVALPIAWFGLQGLGPPQPIDALSQNPSEFLQYPLLLEVLRDYLHPNFVVGPNEAIRMNALTLAGWVGMLITGLNMLPISQLDGGHVAYALLGRRAHLLARGMVLVAIAFIILSRQYGWTIMLSLVVFIGTDHPPTANDRAPLGWLRQTIGWLSLAIPILCFVPIPIRM